MTGGGLPCEGRLLSILRSSDKHKMRFVPFRLENAWRARGNPIVPGLADEAEVAGRMRKQLSRTLWSKWGTMRAAAVYECTTGGSKVSGLLFVCDAMTALAESRET
jgi:hypothetical protein